MGRIVRNCGCDEIWGYVDGYDRKRHYFTCHFYKEAYSDEDVVTDPTEFMKITSTGLVRYFSNNLPDWLQSDVGFVCDGCKEKHPPSRHPQKCSSKKIYDHNKHVRYLFGSNGVMYGSSIKEYESFDL